jgi:predicted metal-dependent peptidase
MMQIEKCALTDQQKKQWEDTLAMMAWTCPGFQHILFKRLTNTDDGYTALATRSIPVAATDSRNIMINPDTFFKYPLRQRVFIAAHEVVHNMYADCEFKHQCAVTGTVPTPGGKTVPFRDDIMQKAMDFRINALLRDSRIGEVPPDALLDDEIATADTSLTEVYSKLYEDEEGGGGGGGKGQGNGFDQVMAPGTSTGQDPSQAASQRNNQAWAIDIAAARKLEEMRSKGDMPGGLKRMFEELLNPKVPWQDFIRSLINRASGSGGYDWSRADDEYIVHDRFEPAPTGKGAGWWVIWGDTSGSIAEPELNKYLGEIGGLLEDVKPTRVTVIWCDAAIDHVDEVTDAADIAEIKARGVGGGGGTSMMPVMEWIMEQTEQPEGFIGMTDGYVDFPAEEPHFPVIWASVSPKGEVAYPFGEVVELE